MATETYTLRVAGVLAGQYRQNIFHFSGNGVDTNDTHHGALDLVSAWNLHLMTPWLNIFPSSYEVREVYARRTFLKPSGYSWSTFLPGLKPGAISANATAQQTCPMIFMVPSMGFHSGGRCFLPAISQGDLANDQYTTGFKTLVDTFMTAATGGVAGTSYTWQLVIASRKLGSSSTIASWYLSPAIGLMKKRKLQSGRGAHKKHA